MFVNVYNFVSVFLLVSSLTGETTAAKIFYLNVPNHVEKGTPTLLDCQYTFDPDIDEELVLKWYHNNSLIYQWIPGRRPHALGILKGKLNLTEYYESNVTGKPNYRALYIANPGLELTGNYTCTVSTFAAEDSQTKRMLVLAPPKNFTISVGSSNATQQAVCVADGMFPLPKVTIVADYRELDLTVVITQDPDGYFSIGAVATIPNNRFYKKITCQLDIDEGYYFIRYERPFTPLKHGSLP
ncbi:hypothetical protein Trydic_g15846 [Trypoxylus dichotomus]